MKYALRYFNTSKKMAEADEIMIRYDEVTPLDHLVWFATEKCRPEQRLVICYDIPTIILSAEDEKKGVLTEEECTEILQKETDKFVELMKEHENISIKVEPTFGKIIQNFVNMLRSAGVPFFLDVHPHTMAEIRALVVLGVSDIYITEVLGFSITDIRKITEGINIRVFPNVAQFPYIYTMWVEEKEYMKSFFIRPEDLEAYEEYVDIIEFYGSLEKQDVLMDIYKDGYWMGGLDELILNFNESINCMNLMPDFGATRIACNHRCDINKCSYCDVSKILAATLKVKDIYLKKTGNREKHEYRADKESGLDERAEAI